MTPVDPCEDPDRLDALRRYRILDSPPEDAFDGIARLAALICKAPIAVINFIDEDRQWFKSEIGLGVRETPLDISICTNVLREPDLFIVPDTTRDGRFASNPLVTGGPLLRFYAGARLNTQDGHALGTLCVLDRVPRELDDEQKAALQTLARQVMAQLELRRELFEQEAIRRELLQARDEADRARLDLEEREAMHRCIAELTFDFAVSGRLDDSGDFVIDRVTEGFAKVTGYSAEELESAGGWPTIVHPDDLPAVRDVIARTAAGQPVRSEVRILDRSGEVRCLYYLGQGLPDRDGTVVRIHLAAQDVTDRKRDERTIAEQIRLLEFGRDVGHSLTESGSIDEMLSRCAGLVVQHLDGAFSRVWTLDESGRELILRASAGMYTHRDGDHARIRVGEYKIGLIAEQRVPHLTNSVLGDPRIPEQDWARREGMVAFAGYPLIVDDRLVGVLAMFARRELSPATLDALESVSRSIALGIERKKAAEAVAENEAWLSTTLQSIGDAVIATDHRGLVRFMNPVAEALTGWAEAEALGRPMGEVFRVVDEQTRTPVEGPAGRGLREGRVVGPDGHSVLIARHGAETPIEDGAAPIRDPSGRLSGVVLVFRDSFQQREAERRLRESERRYRTLIEVSPQIVWHGRSDGHVTYVNSYWYELTGLPPGSTEGFNWSGSIHPDHRERAMDAWSEAIARREPYEVEFPFYRASDGSYRWHLSIGRPLKDSRGEVVQWVGVAIDIDDRKRMEAEARRQSDLLRGITQNATTAIFLIDDRGRCLFMNPAAEAMTGFSFAEAEGNILHDLVHHSRPDRSRYPIDECPIARASPEQAKVREHEDVFIRKDGSFFPVLCNAQPIREEGARSRTVIEVRDITERMRYEQQLRLARDEAEAANRAKTQFLAVLSHELRTPLNPILLAASAMLERPPDPSELRPTLEMIRQNVLLQARLIDDLLDVMRIVRGKMPLHWEVVDCHALLDQAIRICRSEVFGRQLTLDLDLSAECRFVNADPARLQQVFWNLIKNAVKFTPPGGRVRLRTRDEQGERPGETRVVIEFADSGIGIDRDVLPRIFDPFQQGETTITRKFGGLGLGLAICKGIVDAHGGAIEARSEGKDRGTTFLVSLNSFAEPEPRPDSTPSRAASPSPEAGADPDPFLPESIRILVVEDEPATLRVMSWMLRGLGHEVTTAGTIAEARAAIEGSPFDLIVSDIGLPDGSGLDLIRLAVSLRGPVPAIALTGYGMEDDIRRSRDAGFTAHLTKPIDFSKLEAMIHQVRP